VAATGASALSAGLLLLSLPTVNLWPLAWMALVPSMWAVMGAPTHRRGLLYGFITGFVTSAGGLHWLPAALGAYAGTPRAAAIPLFALLCAWQALLFGAFAVCLRVARRHTGLPFALVAPVALVALEFVMPHAVPWSFAMFQAWVLPVIQIAEITGALGVTFCLAMVNGALYDAWLARAELRPLPRRPLVGAAAVMALVLAFGFVRMRRIDARWAAAPKTRIGVVQPNVRFDQKPQADEGGRLDAATAERLRERSARKLILGTARLRAEGAQLVVWPESAYPHVVPHPEAPAETRVPSLRAPTTVPLLAGAISTDDRGRRFNSALLLAADGRVTGRYDKNVLFLLGERVPLLKTLPALQRLFPSGAGAYEPGEGVTTFELADPRAPSGAWRLGPLICLEDLLSGMGGDVGRLRPHALVAIANDSWFGATTEPWEHLALSVFRAVEQRTGMVRAAQTGASAFIDATGRVRAHLAPTDPKAEGETPAGTLFDDVAMLEAGHTVYATLGSLWGLGDLLGFVALAMLGGALASAARSRLRERRSGPA
jgi:apolipoprotein N-acyltransferase